MRSPVVPSKWFEHGTIFVHIQKQQKFWKTGCCGADTEKKSLFGNVMLNKKLRELDSP